MSWPLLRVAALFTSRSIQTIEQVISDWSDIFGSEQPLRATTAADYFDQVYHDVNEER